LTAAAGRGFEVVGRLRRMVVFLVFQRIFFLAGLKEGHFSGPA
jgi:hypothetical protein